MNKTSPCKPQNTFAFARIATLWLASFLIPVASSTAAHPLQTWQLRVAGSQGYSLSEAAYGAGRWVAAGGSNILVSINASNWTALTAPGQQLHCVARAGNLFVVAGKAMTPNTLPPIYVSGDGVNWNSTQTIVRGSTNGIYAGDFNGIWRVLVGENGAVLTSAAAAGFWEGRHNGPLPEVDLHGVCHGGPQSRFFAVGKGGYIGSTGDGSRWQRHESNTAKDLFSVACGNGRFVAVGDKTILYSDDGSTWRSAETVANAVLKGIKYEAGVFVAVGEMGTILFSADGIRWTFSSTGVDSTFSAICHSGRTFLLGGQDGAILQSAPIIGFNCAPRRRAEQVPSGLRGKWQVDFTAEYGRTYQVEATTDFKRWTLVHRLMGSNDVEGVVDLSNPDQLERFYRLAVE